MREEFKLEQGQKRLLGRYHK